MKTVDLNPDRDFKAWLEWRRKGIGASEAGILMGSLPVSWGTVERLLAEKTGQPVRPRYRHAGMKRGLELEPAARKFYEQKTGLAIEVACIENERFPFIRATLDGRNSQAKRSVEIKCPQGSDHQTALRGKIPDKYIWQLVQIGLITGDPVIDYLSFDGKKGVILHYERDRKREMQLVEALVRFWAQVTGNVPPEKKAVPTGTFQERYGQIFKLRSRK